MGTRRDAESAGPRSARARTWIGPLARSSMPDRQAGDGGGGPRSPRSGTVQFAERNIDLSTDVEPELVPGALIPGTRYRVVRRLGGGAMGVVYEAEHADIGRHVAVKILRAHVHRDPAMLAVFRDEARSACRVGSEHIAEIYDFTELPDGRVMYTMELLRGPTLATVIGEGPVAPARVVAIGRQLCKALAAAHASGVVHRDIKPDNIALEMKGARTDVVKVLDFGIAAMAGDRDRPRAAAGTPQYLAPEAGRDLHCDGRLDQYALGCTLYEMLVGQPPFDHPRVSEVMRAHDEEAPPLPSDVRPDLPIPPELEAVVLRALAKHPDDRFADMRDFEAALCEAQVSSGIRTAWDDLPLPDVEPERRQKLAVAMSASTGLAFHDLSSVVRFSRILGVMMAMVVLGTIGIAILWVGGGTEVKLESQTQDQVGELVAQVRDAAAQERYVTRAAGDRGQTALEPIVRLELLGTPDAVAKAAALRAELAELLVDLGDRHWEGEGGRTVAADFYAQALVFQPNHPRARARTVEARQPSTSADPNLPERAEQDESAADHIDVSDGEQQVEVTPPPQGYGAPPKPRSSTRKRPRDERVAPAADATKQEVVRDPEKARSLVARADSALEAGQTHEAEQLYERALALDDRNAVANIRLSDIHFNRGRYAKAVHYARRAVRTAPRNGMYRVRLGDAYFKVLRFQEALEQYGKASALGAQGVDWRLAKVKERLVD